MAEENIPMEIARAPDRAEALRREIRALPARAKLELFHELDKWAETLRSGRDVLGVLNTRYDLCLVECSAPAPWAVIAYDTQRESLVLAALLPERRAVDCQACAQHCASAVGEPIAALICY